MTAALSERRTWVLLGAAALAVVLAVVAFSPGRVLLTRQPERTTTEHDVSADEYERNAEFSAMGRSTGVFAEVSRYRASGRYRILIQVAQPEPQLHSLEVRFHTRAASLSPDALLLEAPGGDWPAMTYGTTRDGDLRFAAESLDFNTTTLTFYLHPQDTSDLPDELGADITFDLRSTVSLVAWRDTVQVDLPLAGLGEPCADVNRPYDPPWCVE